MMPRAGRLALILVAALCVPSLPFLVVGELPGERWLSANDGNALHFALTGAGLLAADVLLPVPNSFIGTLLGVRLGFGGGFIAAFTGLMVGQAAAYFASRAVLRRHVDTLPVAPTLAVVFLSRPVPVLAEAVALAAGAARLSWPQFLLACGCGNAVYAGALALNGARLTPAGWLDPGWVLPLLLPLVGWLIWRGTRQMTRRGD